MMVNRVVCKHCGAVALQNADGDLTFLPTPVERVKHLLTITPGIYADDVMDARYEQREPEDLIVTLTLVPMESYVEAFMRLKAMLDVIGRQGAATLLCDLHEWEESDENPPA